MGAILFMMGAGYAIHRLIRKKEYPEASKILLVGSLIALGLYTYSLFAVMRIPIEEVARDDRFGKEKDLVLNVSSEAEDRSVHLKLLPKSYNYSDVKAIYPEFAEMLRKEMLGQNEEADHVTEDLHFPDNLDQYPFEIAWQTDNTDVIGYDGKLGTALPESGVPVRIRAVIRDESVGFEAEEQFYVSACPKDQKDAFFARLEQDLVKLQKIKAGEGTFILPTSFENRQLSFYEERSVPYMAVFFLTIALSGGLVCVKRDREKKEEEKRMQQLLREYPKIVSKMAMLIGAGMTVKSAFAKIAKEGDLVTAGKNAAYTEMRLACREMESGISESNALFHLGERTRSGEYKKWTSFIIQYTKSGASGLKRALQEEVQTALKERKSRAKKMGEEAGTKLLVPMIMMLVIVMVIIIVPAFHTFQM
ncbi:MAG: type II secretion system F family protein [Lachnospiraceae bacterium]|nr:type II secretion system F family protein [Lachnospiraceae bacterium]